MDCIHVCDCLLIQILPRFLASEDRKNGKNADTEVYFSVSHDTEMSKQRGHMEKKLCKVVKTFYSTYDPA